MANNVNIVINAQDKASQALGRVSDKAKSMRGQFMAMTAIGGAVTGALGMMTKSALDQEIGVRKLDSALKNVNTSYESQAVVIEKTLRALQDKTNFGDEEQREALTSLVRLTGDYETSLQALPVVMDLAVGASMDFKGATTLMGKALTGETSSLSRYGIKIDSTASATEVLARLTEQFGGAAESARDPFDQLGNEMGDLGQAIGNVLLPVMQSLLDSIIPAVKGAVQWTERNPELTKAIVITTGAISGLLVVMGILGLAIPPIVAGYGMLTVAQAKLNLVMNLNPFVAIATVITTLAIVIIPMLIRKFDSFGDFFRALTNKIIDGLNFWIKWMSPVFKLINGLITVWNKFNPDKKLKNIETLLPKFEKGLTHVSVASEKATETQSTLYDTMSTGLEDVELGLGKVNKGMEKLNETTKTSIGLTEEQDYTVKKFYVNYASKVGYTGELINHFIKDHMRLDDERMANRERIAKKEVELEQETVDKKKEINETYLDEFHDMYEEMIIETAGLVNKAHEEMIHELSARDKANKKAQLDESTIPGLSNLPGMKLGREASQVSAIMSANLSGGLRKASGEMMTSAEMREFLGIKLSDTGSIPTIGGTGIPVHEVNINVSPELDAQINFNRVADTLRQKQGDITSNEGQW